MAALRALGYQTESIPARDAEEISARIGDDGLHVNSLVPLLRTLLGTAGLPSPEQFSGHSLRRGFANWAGANEWDLKNLMEYVGWRDVSSAMRYLGKTDPFSSMRQTY